MADNNTYGRILSCKTPQKKMLRKQPGICQKRLEEVTESEDMMTFWHKVIMYLKAADDPWMRTEIDIQKSLARKFESRCQQMPDEIPASKLDELRLELESEFRKMPMNPERTLELRSEIAELSSVYIPGPQIGATLTEPEIAWLRSKNLKFTNDMSISLLGPIFGAPGEITMLLGGTQEQVGAANELGALGFDVATAQAISPKEAVSTLRLTAESHEIAEGQPRHVMPGDEGAVVQKIQKRVESAGISAENRRLGKTVDAGKEWFVVEQDTLKIQRRLSEVTKNVRDSFVKDPKSLKNYLTPGEIDSIRKKPWTMRLFFGTAVERKVAKIAEQDETLSLLTHTVNNAPQDFIGPDDFKIYQDGSMVKKSNGLGYEITGSSISSIMAHSSRPEVDIIVTYESIPSDFGYKWVLEVQ